MKRIGILATLLAWGCLTLPASAAEWQMTVDAEHIEQSFEDGDATLDTITLAPALHLQDWSFYLTIPWQKIDGTVFINNAYPNLAYICGQINSLTPMQILYLIRHDKLTLQQVQYCDSTGGMVSEELQDQATGLSDLELFASYYLPQFSNSLSGTAGLGYKHDNGDAEKGLGTGTRNLYAETSWLLQGNTVGLILTLGYEHLLKNDTDIDYQDYGYGSAELYWRPVEIVTLGAEYHYQQAVADVLDDFDYQVLYLAFGPGSGFGARLFTTIYPDETGYPDKEVGANISYTF